MQPHRKTSAILLLAGLVAGGATLLAPGMRARSQPVVKVEGGGFEARARTVSRYVLRGTAEEHLAITVHAPAGDSARVRPPVNLAVLIDRSGSMLAHQRLDDAKLAARQLVSQLRADDRFSVVAFGSEVKVIAPAAAATPATKDAAYAALDALYPDGGTHISGGLIESAAQIEADPLPGAIARIVMIGDGEPSEGLRAPAQLAEVAREIAARGISITTVGVGLTFDERVMTQIAVSGRGNYYFAENTATLAELFARELASIGATTATSVRVALSPAPGVEVIEAYGYPLDHDGAVTTIPVSDLRAGETRKVVVRLRVSASELGTMKLADVTVSFRNADDGGERTLAMVAQAEVTEDRSVFLDGRDRDAVRAIEAARTANALDTATLLYEQGDHAGALRVLEEKRLENARFADELDDKTIAEPNESLGAASGAFRVPEAAGSEGGRRGAIQTRMDAHTLSH